MYTHTLNSLIAYNEELMLNMLSSSTVTYFTTFSILKDNSLIDELQVHSLSMIRLALECLNVDWCRELIPLARNCESPKVVIESGFLVDMLPAVVVPYLYVHGMNIFQITK